MPSTLSVTAEARCYRGHVPLICPVCRSEAVREAIISSEILVCRCEECDAQFTIRLQSPVPVVTTPGLMKTFC